MANVVNRVKIMDGQSHVTLHVYFQSDGQSGDLTNYPILDPATDLTPLMLPKRQSLIIKQVWYELSNFTATLLFNSLAPWPAWTFTPGVDSFHDFRFFGGISDNSSEPLLDNQSVPNSAQSTIPLATIALPNTYGIDSDGKLLVTTRGFTEWNSSGQLVLWMEKRDRPNPQFY